MKLFNTLVLALTFACFTGCIGKNPANLWFYTHSIDNNAKNDTLLAAASFLNLQDDGSYTRDFGMFDFGKWSYKDGELLLTNQAQNKTKLTVKYIGANNLQLITAKDVIASFDAQPFSTAAMENNPFSLANNRWRIVATHKESEAEIKDRLVNHCNFWIAYFMWADENRLATIDVRSTPTPIKIYGNGFALKPFEELPVAWRTYFFDAEDCKIANNLLYEVFQFHEISWAHTDDKYKMFTGAFQQLKQFLK